MANHNVEWITSARGKSKLVIDNYLFESNGKGKIPGSRYWTCATSSCPITAKTLASNVTEVRGVANGDHGHVNDVTAITSLKLKHAMKCQLDDNAAFSAKRAYNAEVNQLSVPDAAIAPPFSTVERTLQRHKVKNRPPLPATRQALVLPACYTTTTDGRPFKLIDDGQADRIIVFGTSEQLIRLCDSRVWWMDGTFSATPSVFEQLYTVHVKISGEFMPTVWCLLPNKQNVTYVRLFKSLKSEAIKLHRQLNPNVVHIDFELAVIGALRSEFQIEPTGCLFHFSQSLLRNMTGNGLQVMYNTNNPPEVRQTVRRLMAIALVPPLRIDQAFQSVKNAAPNVVGMDVMLDYVQNTYVDPVNAQFDRAIWNCYGMADRTTNCCEAYHRVMNERFRHRNPDPYAFVEFLQEQEMELERRHGQLQRGAPPKKRRPAYVLADEALTRLRDSYFAARLPSVARVMAYMDAVGHQLFDVKH